MKFQVGRCVAALLILLLSATTSLAQNLKDAIPIAEAAEDLARQGEFEAAKDMMLVLEKQFPDWPRPKVQLISLFLLEGNDRQALGRIDELLADPDLPVQIAEVLEQQKAEALDRRIFSLILSASLSPTTNITNGAQAQSVTLGGASFDLSGESLAREGFEAQGMFGLRSRLKASDQLELGLDVSLALQSDWAFDGERLGVSLAPTSQGHVNLELTDSLSLTGKVSGAMLYRLEGFEGLDLDFGLGLDAALSTKTLLRLTLEHAQAFDGDALAFAFSQDEFGLDLHQHLSPRLSGTLGGFLRAHNTPAEHISFDAVGLDVGLNHFAPSGWTQSLWISGQVEQARGIFPGNPDPRRSEILGLGLSLGFPSIAGLDFGMHYRGRWENSTVAFNQRGRQSINLSLGF